MDSPEKISFPSSFSYWERVRASALLMLERKASYVFIAFWPLAAFGLAALSLSKGRPFDAQLCAVVAGCLLFVPAMLLLGAVSTHYLYKQSREPFTYVFDDDGIRAVGVSYEYAHKWPVIFKVKRRAGFLMFFFAPGAAHCIPLHSIADADLQASLIAMAAAKGADVSGAAAPA